MESNPCANGLFSFGLISSVCCLEGFPRAAYATATSIGPTSAYFNPSQGSS